MTMLYNTMLLHSYEHKASWRLWTQLIQDILKMHRKVRIMQQSIEPFKSTFRGPSAAHEVEASCISRGQNEAMALSNNAPSVF